MTFNVYSWFLCITWGGVRGGGGLSPTISLRLGGWESGKFVSVYKFSSPLLSQKRSYIKNKKLSILAIV